MHIRKKRGLPYFREINEKGNCPPFMSILQEASDGNSKCQLWGKIAKGSFWPRAINPESCVTE